MSAFFISSSDMYSPSTNRSCSLMFWTFLRQRLMNCSSASRSNAGPTKSTVKSIWFTTPVFTDYVKVGHKSVAAYLPVLVGSRSIPHANDISTATTMNIAPFFNNFWWNQVSAISPGRHQSPQALEFGRFARNLRMQWQIHRVWRGLGL